ncbi:hypothetical protein DW1_2081 [Proteiniborus sp. DW1]|uniref:hypothetical protein n=1 Tax=Proteiniborus sp. DW1 TaxID=1889883 RepID=UPI00092DF5C2|nr:hypothetical protein [Proteiniborus sp. DW1]SCG83648.1 hypothetical protein DW1_2081 [Proteiniborus sp. DW1]
MSKLKIQLNELNKLYDEIYYSSFDNVEVALDIISNITSEKELDDEEEYVFSLTDIADVIIEVLEEVAEALEIESIYDISAYIRDKIDKIQSGNIDDSIESSYINYLNEDFDEDFDEVDLYDADDDYDEDNIYDDY